MDVEQTPPNPKFRAKLYVLSHESAWEDAGTGFVTIVTAFDDSRRLVFREEDGERRMLYDQLVYPSDTYQLQGEGERQTIIVWEDPETEKDWSLSFQDPDGTAEIWEQISKEPDTADDKRVLPLPKLGGLPDCSRLLTYVPPSQREMFANECISAKFLEALRDSFHTAEDLGAEEALSCIWQITKGLFLLSNQKLIERYLRHDVYEDVFGMLEYDDGLPATKRIAHRQVLKVKVRFSQILRFEDAAIMERIHLNYRLQYLKDIALPRILDDAAFVTLNQMVHANLSVILDHLHKSAPLLDSLFQQLQQKDLQSLLFLQDVCRLAKQIPPLERAALYEKMMERHLFEVLTPFIGERSHGQNSSRQPRHLAVEVLLLNATHDSGPLRRFLTAESSTEGRVLLSLMVKTLLSEEDQGVQSQICETLRLVMDPSLLEQRERDTCLDVFYDRGGLDELIAPLRQDAGVTPASMFGQQLICELLAFAVTHHGYRSRVYVMRHGLAQQALKVMASPQRFLQLAPVRFIKAMVATKDDAYHRYLTKHGVFGVLLRHFHASMQPPALGGNLLVSATLDLLEFIRLENIKLLVDHICSEHGPVIQEHAPKFKTMDGLLLKHRQNLEYEAFPPAQYTSGGPLNSSDATGGQAARRRRSPGREDSDDDEAYFESLDDEDDSEVVVIRAGADATVKGPDLVGRASPPKDEQLAAANGVPPLADLSHGVGDAGVGGSALKGLLGNYEEDFEEDEGDKAPAEDGDAPRTQDTSDAPEAEGHVVQLEMAGDGEATAAEAERAASPPKEVPAEEGEENGKATVVESNTNGNGEKQSLNHVAKRLKTSDSAPV